MIPLTLAQVAEITGGTQHGDAAGVATSAVVDSRQVTDGTLFVAVVGEHVDGHDFTAGALAAGAVGVLGSRPVDGPCVVVPDVVAALGLLARHQVDSTDAVVIGITGSQGKTSVKDLVAHVLASVGPTVAPVGSFNNELGVPLTVLRADADTAFLVVEMGARGIGHIAELCALAPPQVGAVLNVGTAHVSEFGSSDAIAQAKGELVEALPADGVAVLNADDPRVSAMASRTDARVLTFGASGDVRVGDLSVDDVGEPTFTLTHDGVEVEIHVPQLGAHVATNAAAAAAVALAVGVDLHRIGAALATAVVGSAMRLQRDVRADGLLVVNDAYNANPESMAAALRTVAAVRRGRRVAVLGEMLELGDTSVEAHRAVGRLAAELGYDKVVVVGDGAAPIADGAGSIAELVPDVDVAVRTLSAWLASDDVVLVKASRGRRLERVADALLQHGRDPHVG